MAEIILTEEQYNRLFETIEDEGIEYTNTGTQSHPSMNLTINHNMDDASNSGRNYADTRMFGYKHGMLRNTKDGKSMIEQNILDEWSKDLIYRVKIYANSEGRHHISFPDPGRWRDQENMTPPVFFQLIKLKNLLIKKMVEANQTRDFKGLYNWANNWLKRHETETEVRNNLYNRAQNYHYDRNYQMGRKVETYRVGTVPGTNVKFISLFTIDDFNFSDALKNGSLRPNHHTKQILGYEPKNKIALTYDDGIPANVENNFSREDGVDYECGDHYKKSYGLNDKNYTSATMFIDKSIMYAAYALKMENYQPQYIIAAPSSSPFNHYYSTALANKLGTAEYVPDFFKRNLINFKNEQGVEIAEQMKKDGIEERLITDFLKTVNNMALNEIAAYVAEPLRTLIGDNYNMFANISAEHYARERVDMKVLTRLALNYTYNMMLKNMDAIKENNALPRYLLEVFFSYNKYVYENDLYLIEEIRKRIDAKIGRRVFQAVLAEMWKRINETSTLLESKGGYKLKFNQPFKVTKLSKKTRPYLTGIYAVADKNFNKNKELFSKFTHANFLLIDEDMNSGTTLRNSIEALQDVMPEQNTSQIVCLTNAYSPGGF